MPFCADQGVDRKIGKTKSISLFFARQFYFFPWREMCCPFAACRDEEEDYDRSNTPRRSFTVERRLPDDASRSLCVRAGPRAADCGEHLGEAGGTQRGSTVCVFRSATSLSCRRFSRLAAFTPAAGAIDDRCAARATTPANSCRCKASLAAGEKEIAFFPQQSAERVAGIGA